MDVKQKALSGIKEMLEERLSGRMKPKAVAVDVTAVGGEPKPEMEGEELQAPPGGDISKLTPEEQMQLQALYDKMGC